jgi:sugar phosphate isomerase/epimerase
MNKRKAVIMLKVGLILYSVRDEMAKDPLGTVETVASLGYKNIEVCNHSADTDSGCGFGVDAHELRAAFDKYGSKVISAHVYPFDKSDLKAVLEYNNVLGNKYIVNPMGTFTTYDDLMHQCEEFNRLGRICQESGLTYLYHNHYHEYRTFGGKAIIDIIAENTDPGLVGFELDTFWTMRAGRDPKEIMKRLGKRIKLIHQKDFAWDSIVPINVIGLRNEDYEIKSGETVTLQIGIDPSRDGENKVSEEEMARRYATAFTEIGTGIMKIQDIIDAANEYTGAGYIILEQDHTRMASEIDSVKKSMDAFKKFNGISWEG